jgi:hypothetical protein
MPSPSFDTIAIYWRTSFAPIPYQIAQSGSFEHRLVVSYGKKENLPAFFNFLFDEKLL